MRWATFRDSLETAESRKIIGFDAFGNFPDEGLTRQDDIDFANSHDDDSGGPGISKERLTALLKVKGKTIHQHRTGKRQRHKHSAQLF